MVKSEPMKSLPAEIARIGLGAIFLVAGVMKAADPPGFFSNVQGYRLFSYHAAIILSLYLPWIEIVCGLGLLLKKCYAGALSIALVSLTAFTGALLSAWWRKLNIECGCFDLPFHQAHYALWFVRDLLLIGITTGLLRDELENGSPHIAARRTAD